MKETVIQICAVSEKLKSLCDIAEQVKTVGPSVSLMSALESIAPDSLPQWAALETFSSQPSFAGLDDANKAIAVAKKRLTNELRSLTVSLRD